MTDCQRADESRLCLVPRCFGIETECIARLNKLTEYVIDNEIDLEALVQLLPGVTTSHQGLRELSDRIEVRLHVLWCVRDRDRRPEPPARLPYAPVGKEQPDERTQARVVGVPGATRVARRLRAE